MTHLAIEHALLAVLAARGGDKVTATHHIARAQKDTRATARRERQLVEIAALVVTGDMDRAGGLALEHVAEFPGDAELLACVSPTGTREPSRSPATH
jgi:hypothetical protein